MPDPAAAPTAARNCWWDPLFLLVFAPGAGAWVGVVGWLVWGYFNPVRDWVNRQPELLQELLTTLVIGVVVLLLVGGVAVAHGIADRAAGIPPRPPALGQKHGQHAKWTPPKRG